MDHDNIQLKHPRHLIYAKPYTIFPHFSGNHINLALLRRTLRLSVCSIFCKLVTENINTNFMYSQGGQNMRMTGWRVFETRWISQEIRAVCSWFCLLSVVQFLNDI